MKLIRFNSTRRVLGIVAALVVASVTLIAQPSSASISLGDPYIGNPGKYDYSPTMIQNGSQQNWWWCGQTDTDTILQQSYSPTAGKSAATTAFNRGSAGQWDSAFVCNPVAVRGTFTNPFSDGQNYGYAIYYVGTNRGDGLGNSIGVAFSKNGTTWRKYPNPVIVPEDITDNTYGVSEPAAVNMNNQSNIRLFFGDSTRAAGYEQVVAESTDGVNFTRTAIVTDNGIYAHPNIGNSDFGLDTATNTWYMTVPSGPLRPKAPGSGPSDYQEREFGEFTLYRISDANLFNPNAKWEQLTTIGMAQTGYVVNAIPGFARDQYGKLNTVPQWPTVQMFFNVSNPRPGATATALDAQRSAATDKWDITWAAWNGQTRTKALTRYFSSTTGTHQVTTGYVDSAFNVVESTLGTLREAPSSVATRPLYSCKVGAIDYFVSKDINCEGQFVIGLIGYAASSASAASGLTPLYRCYANNAHFVSSSSTCEGQIVEQLLGYALP